MRAPVVRDLDAWRRENLRRAMSRSRGEDTPLFAIARDALAASLLDDDALDPKRDAFATALADSPAWGAYFAAVGATFDHGAARARRHPKRVQ